MAERVQLSGYVLFESIRLRCHLFPKIYRVGNDGLEDVGLFQVKFL